ncbi:aminodeoxychorismate lyase [Lysobacter tyrosinilyticus]
MNARIFVGDTRFDAIAADDRGVAYGDGLFETMRAHRGELPWWDAHWARLQAGAHRLRIVLPEPSRVHTEAASLLSGKDAVLKLIVTRGSSGRGYAPDADNTPTWIVSVNPLPPAMPETGITVRWCETRLALQPALAGMKHCNRMEQVLARTEWLDPMAPDKGAAEGLMRSMEGDVVCATAANLFVLRDGTWLTPRIDRCGVAGVCRAWAMDALTATQSRIAVTDVETADAVFLCNAVRGILPVAKLGERTWSLHPQVVALRRQLALAHPAFTQ